jgi:hypothetical protein
MTAVVYWDMATCGIPDDVWWYSAATCVDRFLRVNGLLDTGAGWKFECHAAIPFLSSGKRRRELLEARVQVRHAASATPASAVCWCKQSVCVHSWTSSATPRRTPSYRDCSPSLRSSL